MLSVVKYIRFDINAHFSARRMMKISQYIVHMEGVGVGAAASATLHFGNCALKDEEHLYIYNHTYIYMVDKDFDSCSHAI